MSEEASDKQELTETSSANEDCSECDDPCKSVFTKGLGILANAIIVNPIVERTYYPRVYTHKSLRPTSCTAPKQVLNINDIIREAQYLGILNDQSILDTIIKQSPIIS